jgi:hypothetical protein
LSPFSSATGVFGLLALCVWLLILVIGVGISGRCGQPRGE